MAEPMSTEYLLNLRNQLLLKRAFVPSGGTAASMGAPAGAPMGDPAAAAGGAPMDPAAMGGGAPPMDPAAMGGGGAPMDPAAMGGGGAPPGDPTADPASQMAPDGTSPFPPQSGSGGGGEKGSKVKAEDIVLIQQLLQQLGAEVKLTRDLLLDIMKHSNIPINPDTLRSSVTNNASVLGGGGAAGVPAAGGMPAAGGVM